MIIKVCGMREPDNIRAVEQLGVQWIGFIFWPPSSRYVSQRPSYLPLHAQRVGVFVDADINDVISKTEAYALDIIQLHGTESPDYLSSLRTACSSLATVPRLMKALSIRTRADMEAYQLYEGLVDYFLFDTKGPSVGGNGTQFDWSLLDSYQGTAPFLLSGGIGPDDASAIRSISHPQLLGIDLNSRFESAPALKDTALLQRFLLSL